MVIDWLVLNSIPGLGPARIKRLLEQFGSPEKILGEHPECLTQTGVMFRADSMRAYLASVRDEAMRQLELAQQKGVLILGLDSDDYPVTLKQIFAPPPVLFVRGTITALKGHAVAVVGTRQPTSYGRQATTRLCTELAQSGLRIVSGLALGVDALAHESCLAAGGVTVAVFGCGVDLVYPSSNRALAERILGNGGALVSEFPLGTPPLRHNFPRRNRIISGLSAGVLVVEAGCRSGSLITAAYALQQGRDVFAVPGPIFSDKSVGTFELIKQGATPVRRAADIIESIQVLTIGTCEAGRVTTSFPQDLLSDDERGIYGHVTDTPLRFDQIASITGYETADLLNILLNLELKGVIRQVAGQQYVRV